MPVLVIRLSSKNPYRTTKSYASGARKLGTPRRHGRKFFSGACGFQLTASLVELVTTLHACSMETLVFPPS